MWDGAVQCAAGCFSCRCCESHTHSGHYVTRACCCMCVSVCACEVRSLKRGYFLLLLFLLPKCAPIAAGSRFRVAHPQAGAAGRPRRGRSTGSPRMTSGLKSTSLPGPHPPERSKAPSPQRPGSEPRSTGS